MKKIKSNPVNKIPVNLLLIIMFFSCASLLFSSCKEKDNTASPVTEDTTKASFYLSDANANIFFTEQPALTTAKSVKGTDTIIVNSATTYQVMDGFGFSLTGGSAYHINKMDPASRRQLLTELFDNTGSNIGVSYLRVSIGASDLDFKVFSYDDMPTGQYDLTLEKFSLDQDRKYVIPVLKEILAINPNIKILGSPWSAPLWMKTTRDSIGGSLRTTFYDHYAKYLVKYIQEMQKEGITIDAITVQNEPLHGGNNPSMVMYATDQALFIKNNLGPAFRAAGISTKIIIYDHNADRVDYPLTVLGDPAAKQYIDGTAFHLYGGQIGNISQVHTQHPDKNLYYTEMWVGAGSSNADNLKWHMRELMVGAPRNWCRNVLEWNLAADENQDPHTNNGGCDRCLGAVTITGNQVTKNIAYYIVAHASKFVRPGSVRIQSNSPIDLPNVAYKTPDGKTVLIVMNNSDAKKVFNIKVGDKYLSSSLTTGSAATYIW